MKVIPLFVISVDKNYSICRKKISSGNFLKGFFSDCIFPARIIILLPDLKYRQSNSKNLKNCLINLRSNTAVLKNLWFTFVYCKLIYLI